MFLKNRLLAPFVGVAVISLILLGSINYNSSLEFKNRLETDSLKDFTQYLLTSQDLKNKQELSSVVMAFSKVDNNKYLVFLTDESGKIHPAQSPDTLDASTILQLKAQLTPIIKQKQTSGTINSNGHDFHWFIDTISNTPYKLLLLHQASGSLVKDYFRIFVIPFIISAIIIIWAAIWGALILASLFRKLEAQKQTVEAQAKEISQARDQALKTTLAKSDFLANMSHEIRTPLTSIIGFSEELLQDNQSKKETHQSVSAIIRNGKYLLHLINEILDLSKIEAGKIEIDQAPVSITQLLADVEILIQPQAEEKGLAFGINYDFPLPKVFISDPHRLKQILINITANAVKFTPHGHVHIQASCDVPQQKMIFEIGDSGIGISKEQQQKIFSPFAQADSSITRKYGGTGLGLSLSKHLVELLGGTISLRSEPGIGSRFKIEIATGSLKNAQYLYEMPQSPENTMVQDIPKGYEPLSGKVLLAEDNKGNRRLLNLCFNKMGLSPTIVENGRQALDSLKSNEFDIAFFDIHMPVMDGLEAVKMLRRQGYTKPVVALTAGASKQDRERDIEAGFDDIVLKPVDRDILYSVTSRYLGHAVVENTRPITSSLLDDPDFKEIVICFVSDLPQMQNAIKNAVEQQDVPTLTDLMHQLKSSAGGVGYDDLAELSAKIEKQLKHHNIQFVLPMITTFNGLCDRIYAGMNKDNQQNVIKFVSK